MLVNFRVDFNSDNGDEGVVRGRLNLPQIPQVGEEIQILRGKPFYEVEQVLYSAVAGKTTVNLGTHNFAPATVRALRNSGFTVTAR